MGDARRRRSDLLGESLTALCGGALALNLLLIAGLLALLAAVGLAYFWPKRVERVFLADGTVLLGEVHDREPLPVTPEDPDASGRSRIQLKIGNRDLVGLDFRWVDERQIVRREAPPGVLMLERLEWGNFYGFPVELRRGEGVVAAGSEAVLAALPPLLEAKHRAVGDLQRLERGEIGDVNHAIEKLRRERKKAAGDPRRTAELSAREQEKQREYDTLAERMFTMREALMSDVLVMETASGERKEIAVGNIVRAIRPNAMGAGETVGLYLSRIREFVFDDPRESNTEGGIFPAIFGTVMMVFLMSFAVAPFGVLAALYLREYAKQGPLVRVVRIAVNNLAGVPSIVFGMFGLGFFVYLIGGSIDRLLYSSQLPTPTFGTGGILWASLTLALLTVPVVIVATEEGLAAVPRIVREGSLALGATKFETTYKVVLPAAAPGILTGMILAMARAAGEVAPLMIVGMVKLAPSLPVDHHAPFVHFERKFMHLGFHIYDVGFQSPNVEATKPLVFATALLLILVVTAVNLVAILVRNHLRRKYASSAI
ncbi:MAG TPA: phosphate ABC transporter permease PstA [Candidatus Polarisedimenticolaceae bacterium]